MANSAPGSSEVPLSWARQDFEQRLAFKGGRYTHVNTLLSAIMGLLIAAAFYALLVPIHQSAFARMFLTQNFVVPATICFLTGWSISILFIKSRKLEFQRRALAYSVVPKDHDFVLSSTTVDQVTDQIHRTVDDPKQFVLFNRIMIALSNLRNLGRVGDVDEILRSQAEHDESTMETSYSIVSVFVWAIPVLGFIGTVIGLSIAIGEFGSVLQASDDMTQIKGALQGVTGGLKTAFETTLQALVAALGIQLALAFLKKSEEQFLDDCSEYCVKNIVNRLRLMVYEEHHN